MKRRQEDERTTDGKSAVNLTRVKWSWSCRHLLDSHVREQYTLSPDCGAPKIGDVGVIRIDRIGHHTRIDSQCERKLRLYRGDHLVCAFGNRYATDVYEGRVRSLKKLHLLTSSGIVGTVVNRNRTVGRPTAVSFLGYLANDSGDRVNLKDLLFRPLAGLATPDVILVVGTGMNTGKTTVTRKILRALVSRGVPVAGCKLTGTASPRDLYEYRGTGARHTVDFSEYGFPSTYRATSRELHDLLDTMIESSVLQGCQLVIVEVADGFLQHETQMLLNSEIVRQRIRGVVLAGACAGSALYAADCLEKSGLDVWAVSGLMTNAPLSVQEFKSRSVIPVASSSTRGDRLAKIVVAKLADRVSGVAA